MMVHDPILRVVPLKLTEILQTISHMTRWYRLNGGIGFGRIKIPLLFPNVETGFPPQQLGWDVGIFEFFSEKTIASGDTAKAKMKI